MPTAAATVALAPEDVATWASFRARYGLRSDLEWVRMVAKDPTAISDFAVPMLPSELATVVQHDTVAGRLAPAVEEYGRAFEEFAGVVIDGPIVEISFTTHAPEHRALLLAMFPDSHRIVVKTVRYSLLELEELAARVEAERAWFGSVGAELYRADPMTLTNTVRVRYIAVDRTVEADIRDHFGRPGWLDLVWYASPAWDGPSGDLVVRIVDSAGRQASGTCSLVSVELGVYDGGLPLESDSSGQCVYPRVPAIPVRVTVEFERADGSRGSVRDTVEISPGRDTILTIRLDQ